MQANGPSPHAVSVRPSAASRAFDLWLHVSIEAFQFLSHCNLSRRCTVRFEEYVIFMDGFFKLVLSANVLYHTSSSWEGKASQAFVKLTC